MIGLEIDPECSLICAGTTLDGASATLRVGQEQRDLTATEFTLLREMFKHPNVLLSKQRLMSTLYLGRPVQPAEGIIRVYIHRLRQLLQSTGSPLTIQTRHGMGWMLSVPEASAPTA